MVDRPAKKSILVVTPYPLLPAVNGGRLYVLSTIEPLAREYDFYLLALCNPAERKEYEKDRAALMGRYLEIFRGIYFEERPLIPAELGSRWKVMKHLVTHALFGLPLMDLSYYQPKAVRTAKALIKRHKIELMEVHHLHAAFYRRFIRDIPAVLVNHNIESELWPFWAAPQGPQLARRVWDYFGKISRKNARDIEIGNKYAFDAKFFISAPDMLKVRQNECQCILLPMSVATDRTPKRFHPDKFVMLWIGGFLWPPNSEAATWFMAEIWPLIREKSPVPLEMHFVGSDPPKALSDMHDGKEVFVHGHVHDIEDFRRKADVFVVPLKAGGGVRIKIIEALNAGIPVVTTSKGCEGLAVENGKNILIADDPEYFANAVLRLAGSQALRDELSRSGREYCAEHHNPERIAIIKKEVYGISLREHLCWKETGRV